MEALICIIGGAWFIGRWFLRHAMLPRGGHGERERCKVAMPLGARPQQQWAGPEYLRMSGHTK